MLIDQWKNVPVSFFGNADNVFSSEMLAIKSALYKAIDSNKRNPFKLYAGDVNSVPLNIFNNVAYKCYFILKEDPFIHTIMLTNLISCYPNLPNSTLSSIANDTFYYEKAMNDFQKYHSSIDDFNLVEDDYVAQFLEQDQSLER